jgi:hypothetical protein
MSRSKGNLVSSAPLSWDEEHKFGPGSATCFCRVMNRRDKARQARQRLVVAVSHDETRKICVPPMKARLGRPVVPAQWRRA